MNTLNVKKEISCFDGRNFLEKSKTALYPKPIIHGIISIAMSFGALWSVYNKKPSYYVLTPARAQQQAMLDIILLSLTVICFLFACYQIKKIMEISKTFLSLGEEIIHISEYELWGTTHANGIFNVEFSNIKEAKKVIEDKMTLGSIIGKVQLFNVSTLQIITFNNDTISLKYLGNSNVNWINSFINSKINDLSNVLETNRTITNVPVNSENTLVNPISTSIEVNASTHMVDTSTNLTSTCEKVEINGKEFDISHIYELKLDGNYIEAIKELRILTGINLKKAKEFIDSL